MIGEQKNIFGSDMCVRFVLLSKFYLNADLASSFDWHYNRAITFLFLFLSVSFSFRHITNAHTYNKLRKN